MAVEEAEVAPAAVAVGDLPGAGPFAVAQVIEQLRIPDQVFQRIRPGGRSGRLPDPGPNVWTGGITQRSYGSGNPYVRSGKAAQKLKGCIIL